MNIHKVAVEMESNHISLPLKKTIKYNKIRISYFNFTTQTQGGQKIYFLLHNHNKHPVYGKQLSFDHYFKVLPLYSAPSQQFFYLNNQSYDLILDSANEISSIDMYVLVNGSYENTQINNEFPINMEIEFILD